MQPKGCAPLRLGRENRWPCACVRGCSSLVLARFGVELSLASIGVLLARLGLTPQSRWSVPTSVMRKRSSAGSVRLFPPSPQKPAAVARTSCSGTKRGFAPMRCMARRGSCKGKRRSSSVPGSARSISAASAVSAKGAFWFAVYQGALTGEMFVQLLEKMMYRRKKPVRLVLDSSP